MLTRRATNCSAVVGRRYLLDGVRASNVSSMRILRPSCAPKFMVILTDSSYQASTAARGIWMGVMPSGARMVMFWVDGLKSMVVRADDARAYTATKRREAASRELGSLWCCFIQKRKVGSRRYIELEHDDEGPRQLMSRIYTFFQARDTSPMQQNATILWSSEETSEQTKIGTFS